MRRRELTPQSPFGLVGAWLKAVADSRSSVKVAKFLTRIRGSARLLEGIDPTPGSIRFEPG